MRFFPVFWFSSSFSPLNTIERVWSVKVFMDVRLNPWKMGYPLFVRGCSLIHLLHLAVHLNKQTKQTRSILSNPCFLNFSKTTIYKFMKFSEHEEMMILQNMNNFEQYWLNKHDPHCKYFDCTQYSFWQCYMCHCNLVVYITALNINWSQIVLLNVSECHEYCRCLW